MKKLSYKAKWNIATVLVFLPVVALVILFMTMLTKPTTTSQTGYIYVKIYRIEGQRGFWLDFLKTEVDTFLTFKEKHTSYIIDENVRNTREQTEISIKTKVNKLTVIPFKVFTEKVRLDNYVIDVKIDNPKLLVNLFKAYHNIVLYELIKLQIHIVIEDAAKEGINLKNACDEHLKQFGICVTNIRNKKDLTFEEIYIN